MLTDVRDSTYQTTLAGAHVLGLELRGGELLVDDTLVALLGSPRPDRPDGGGGHTATADIRSPESASTAALHGVAASQLEQMSITS